MSTQNTRRRFTVYDDNDEEYVASLNIPNIRQYCGDDRMYVRALFEQGMSYMPPPPTEN